MDKYKFNFRYTSNTMDIKGDGTVNAESEIEAIDRAAQGVAKDLNCNVSSVLITSIRKLNAKK